MNINGHKIRNRDVLKYLAGSLCIAVMFYIGFPAAWYIGEAFGLVKGY